MFKNNHAYFNRTMKTEEAKSMLSNYNCALEKKIHADAVKYYNQICKNMRLRVEGNYIKPINTFMKATKASENRENFGFIVMGIICAIQNRCLRNCKNCMHHTGKIYPKKAMMKVLLRKWFLNLPGYLT